MDKKDFYLKKIGRRGKITIWLVDGNEVRRNFHKEFLEEFTNFAQHFRLPFIPEYEFWIDREAVPDERRFFIDHLLTEWRLMKEGLPYQKAREIASRKEFSERQKIGDLKKVLDKKGQPSPEKVHRQFLKRVNGNVSIWLVYGRLARSAFDVEFTEGGHDLVYKYIPSKEVWLDDDVIRKERPYIIFHEIYERSLMKKGLNYIPAHRKASRLEWQARYSREKLKESLILLGWEKENK